MYHGKGDQTYSHFKEGKKSHRLELMTHKVQLKKSYHNTDRMNISKSLNGNTLNLPASKT